MTYIKKRKKSNAQNKKRPSIKNQYKESLRYLRETLPYIYFTVVLFIVAGVAGFILRSHLTFIDEILKELLLRTEGLNAWQMILFILQNNFMSSLFAVIFGLFVGMTPLFSSISNGVLVGYVLGKSLDISGSTQWWRLIPHGIFELPAIFISLALGFRLGFGLLKNYHQQSWKNSKTLAFLPIILSILFLLISIPSSGKILEQLPYDIPSSFAHFFLVQMFVMFLAFFYVIFIISTMISDKKMRSAQISFLRHDFSSSLVTFFLIVFPLLIVAAIIEGLLIVFAG